MFFSAPEIVGGCVFVNSTRDSLTFTWQSATSATSYRLVGDGANITSERNTITVNDLVPGSRYTFIVWAVDAQGLTNNTITCINSTGVIVISINKRNRYFLRTLPGKARLRTGLAGPKRNWPLQTSNFYHF